MSIIDTALHIRPLDTHTDMLSVADLIEICFGSQLDPDGFTYLEQIRKAALDQRLVRWALTAGEMVSYPLNGYVCELDHQVIGNLSIIPFYWKHEWYYLIANVAVHPNFRRQGIAHRLTAKALEHLRRLPIRAVWLHVREDNLAARHLYVTFQFQDRCVRDTWVSSDLTNNLLRFTPGIQIGTPAREDWPSMKKYLNGLYPPEVTWNLGFDAERYKPGLLQNLVQMFSDEKLMQWSVKTGGQFAAAAVLEKSPSYADHIFLAWPPDGDERVITTLLPYIKANFSPTRPLLVNLPAHVAENALPQAGFELLTRLIWMEIRING